MCEGLFDNEFCGDLMVEVYCFTYGESILFLLKRQLEQIDGESIRFQLFKKSDEFLLQLLSGVTQTISLDADKTWVGYGGGQFNSACHYCKTFSDFLQPVMP